MFARSGTAMSSTSSKNSSRAAAPRAAAAVESLKADLKRSHQRRWVTPLALVLLLGGGGLGFAKYRAANAPAEKSAYITQSVERRDILELVQSTGKIRPLREVQIGAQVSGRVVEVNVDFNSEVKKGDLLAKIDPTLLGAQVHQTTAQIDAARAAIERAKANVAVNKTQFERLRKLGAENLASQADIDTAEARVSVTTAELASARAQLKQLTAQLSQARTTLDYTVIRSPIDGVVIARSVDPGQTVAASFSAPVLFVIAEDLSKMQVLAGIDEADVGKLKEGMPAEIVVDAFPGEKFTGTVTQIRYSPTELQGVVTYAAVVDVANPDLKLRPGMTATASIVTRKAEKALAVPNAALRFKPNTKSKESPGKAKAPVPLSFGQGRLYTVVATDLGSDEEGAKERAEARITPTGITDGMWTELRGDNVSEGLSVITSQRDSKRRKKILGVF